MTTTLTLPERAFRGLLLGVSLLPSEVVTLFEPSNAERRGAINERLRLACESGEISATAVTERRKRREARTVPCRFYGEATELVDIEWDEVTGWRIAPEAMLTMAQALRDDLPLIDEDCPALMAWLGLPSEAAVVDDDQIVNQAAILDEVQARTEAAGARRNRGGGQVSTQFIEDTVAPLPKDTGWLDALAHVERAIRADIAGLKSVFTDEGDGVFVFRHRDGNPDRITRRNLADRVQRACQRLGKRAA